MYKACSAGIELVPQVWSYLHRYITSSTGMKLVLQV